MITHSARSERTIQCILHALELEEESPEERTGPVEGQVAALSEAEETEDEVQYDSEPAKDDASEDAPEETGEVAVLSPARVSTGTDLEAINHCLFPMRIHGHASQALYDTGATHSVISKALYDTLQDPPELTPTRCSLQVGNGETDIGR